MRFAIPALALLIAAPLSAGPCAAPEDLTATQQRDCVRNASLAVAQPDLSIEQILKGPDFDPGDPQGSRWLYFEQTDKPLCYFKPHYAFNKVKGRSLKYRCWQMNPDRRFFDEDGDLVENGDFVVQLRQNSEGLNRGRLYRIEANGEETRIRADELKVKYLKPDFPNHNTRYNEVFTEVASTRFMWMLGFLSDRAYSVDSVQCVGCDADPFKSQKENRSKHTDAPRVFPVSSVEREHDYDPLEADGDETWSWTDTARFSANAGGWSAQQRAEYDAYRLALRLINYHNQADQQNRLVCAKWQADDNDSGVCEQPMIFVQDVGSTFGKPKSFLGSNPRGRYKAYARQPVFKRKETCELLHTLGSDRRVLEAGRQFLVERLGKLNREKVRAAFETARFDRMDQEQRRRLQQAGSSDVGKAALDEWTDTFMARIDEIKTATGCRP